MLNYFCMTKYNSKSSFFSKTKVLVTLLDANHVPGAVMILIKGYFGNILYCGDFRYRPEMLKVSPSLNLVLNREDLDELYLDNTFFYPTCDFSTRNEVTEKIISVLQKHPQHRVYIGLRKLGKEQVLVEIAKRLDERILVTEDKFEMLKILEMPDVFTTDPNSSRIHCVHMNLLKRKFLEAENRKTPTIGLMLTALYYGWDCPNVPYSISETWNLYVMEYSDHSSYSELIEFVQAVKPKVVKPIIDNNQAFGLMREWESFHNVRIDMSPLKKYLSKLPMKITRKPDDILTHSSEFTTLSKKPKMFQVKPRLYYRGPKGAVYETASETNTTSSVANNTMIEVESKRKLLLQNLPNDVESKSESENLLSKFEVFNDHLNTVSHVTKGDLNELNEYLDLLMEEIP